MRQRGSTALLAGWLFADALLAITLIALGSESAPPRPAAAATPSPSPSPTPSPAARPAGVEQTSIRVLLPEEEVTDAAVRQRFSALLKQKRRAAFALTFGVSPEPGAGVEVARRRNAQLLRAAPELFKGSAQRDFWQAVNETNPGSGDAVVEVFLFTR